MYMEKVFEMLATYNNEIIIGIIAIVFIQLILFLILNAKLSNMKKRYKKLLRGKNNANIEELLLRYGAEIDDLKNQIDELNKTIDNLNKKLSFAIQKVGFVRYNAFEDMGYELSFSIAFLDDLLNGYVITSIYNKGQSMCYAKPIKNGKSIYPLSVEEMQSIDRAINGNILIDEHK